MSSETIGKKNYCTVKEKQQSLLSSETIGNKTYWNSERETTKLAEQ